MKMPKHNNRPNTKGRYHQAVMSAPSKIKVGEKTLITQQGNKVVKNIYRKNIHAKQVGIIAHIPQTKAKKHAI
jgi:hypothetical protein